VFVRGVQAALLDGRADLAVHSFKDLPSASAAGLEIVAVPRRAAVHDVLVVKPEWIDRTAGPIPLRPGARVGTGALRRTSQLRSLREDLRCVPIRGNVPTRVAQLNDAHLEAVMVAAAGLDRLALDLAGYLRVDLDPRSFLPAPAQGALALEMRVGDPLQASVRRLHDHHGFPLVAAERQLLALLDAGCQLSLGASASLTPDGIELLAYFEGQRARALAGEPVAVAEAVFAALVPTRSVAAPSTGAS
jgi:hydroxymethylbilane synthase